ncbi:MAG: hypothetical protein JO133_04985 [Burkholderiaceae bacterium]|nr:hypothetical protein [Burkholderiaceae bacterium]
MHRVGKNVQPAASDQQIKAPREGDKADIEEPEVDLALGKAHLLEHRSRSLAARNGPTPAQVPICVRELPERFMDAG